MLTFAQLKQHPELLTPDVRSPIIHPDNTMTALWEGDAGGDSLVCVTEWWEQPQPLEQLPGTSIWGGDFPTPDLPGTVCTTVGIGNEREGLPSPQHNRYLLGPDLPAPLPPEGSPRRRVGTRRGAVLRTVLFRVPPSEPGVRLSTHRALQQQRKLPHIRERDTGFLLNRRPACRSS